MNRVKAFFSMGFLSCLQMLVGIIRGKITAVLLGPVGISVTSILNNISGTLLPITSLGFTNGIIREISNSENDEEKINKVMNTSVISIIITSTITLLGIAIFSPVIAKNQLDNSSYIYSLYVIVLGVSIFFSALNTIPYSALNGFKDIKAIARTNIINSLANILISVIMIYFFRITGAVLSILFLALFNLVNGQIHLNKIFKSKGIRVTWTLKYFNINIFKQLLMFGVTSMVAMVGANLSILMIRNTIIAVLGINANAMFQVNLSIMNQYIGLIFSSATIYYFPTLCEIKENKGITLEINKTIQLLTAFIMPVFLIIIPLRGLIIDILFSREFKEAAMFLPLFILGDFFKCISWACGTVFGAINKLKAFVICDVVFNAIITVISMVLIRYTKSIYGVTYGYIIGYILVNIVYYLLLRKYINFSFMKYNIKTLSLSLIILIINIIVSYKLENNNIALFFIPIATLVLWFYVAIEKETRVKLFSIIRSKLNKLKKA